MVQAQGVQGLLTRSNARMHACKRCRGTGTARMGALQLRFGAPDATSKVHAASGAEDLHACIGTFCSCVAAHQMPQAKCTGTESRGSSMRQALSALEVASMMRPDAMPMMTAP